ncbi:hypothetical protein G7Y89_g10730 [Cudoniella acicularis]|uniref:lytic cellulose monooxygenase (C4-dehydrogenating) n=1 Tax=Cudoniella acicularis TaxID=354080 RepID=A0A8H4RC71_9HELO|nr:hypothetical protein G7Y89_g10730 [Cudoniella acicularis]
MWAISENTLHDELYKPFACTIVEDTSGFAFIVNNFLFNSKRAPPPIMKTFAPFCLALVALAEAHYTFVRPEGNGIQSSNWQHVRQPKVANNGGTVYDPIEISQLNTTDIRCNVGGTKNFAPKILSVKAGSTITLRVEPYIFHPGPLMGYLAKVPAGKKASTWDGSGQVWFKFYEEGPPTVLADTQTSDPVSGSSSSMVHWASQDEPTKWAISYTIPKSLPNGDYLLRAEHLGTHLNPLTQFFVSCLQITVTNGGTGTPGPLVEFPGAYKPTDPAFVFDQYNKTYVLTNPFKNPGPPVWVG